MTTSAQALNEVLSYLLKQGSPDDRFLSAAASFLRIPGPDAEAEAALAICRALTRVRSDVEALPFSDSEKRQLNNYLSVFNGIASFSQLHLDLKSARINFLKADHLVGLMNVHMALSGHTQQLTLNADFKEIAAEARELGEQIELSNLPERAKYALKMRLAQVASTLDNYKLFGTTALEKDIETLLGAIAFHSDAEEDDSDSGFLKGALKLAMNAANLLKTADGSFGSALALANKGKQAWALIKKD